jgi:lipocalin
MTYKEAYKIMLQAKPRIAYVPARNPIINAKKMEEALTLMKEHGFVICKKTM